MSHPPNAANPEGGWMGAERRRFPRIGSRLTTFVKFLDTGKVVRVLTEDVSAAGVRFVTEGLLEPGTTLELEMKLPDLDRPMTCRAEVVWSQVREGPRKSYEKPLAAVAVKFVEIDPKTRSLLLHYVAMGASPGAQ
jgi:hypothetical protein